MVARDKAKRVSFLLMAILVTVCLCACGNGDELTKKIAKDPSQIGVQEPDTKETESQYTEIIETEDTETEILEEELPTVEELIAQYKEMDAFTLVDVTDFSEEDIDQLFYYEEISDELFDRIYGLSFKKDCTVPRSDLRYVRLLHMDIEGEVHIGELIVNKGIADDVIEIFRELYRNDYAIGKMTLVDDYDADDTRSMEDNNTSCFNFRPVEGTGNLSKHALGRAIDLNPQYNPYVHKVNGKTVISPYNGQEYGNRSKDFPYKIDENDLAYKLFTEHGFFWGGHWKSMKDYQHFQKEK